MSNLAALFGMHSHSSGIKWSTCRTWYHVLFLRSDGVRANITPTFMDGVSLFVLLADNIRIILLAWYLLNGLV